MDSKASTDFTGAAICALSSRAFPESAAHAAAKIELYWNEHFQKLGQDGEDWFCEFESLRSILMRVLNGYSAQILIVGCGHSRLGECLYDAGFVNITNSDISTVAIQNMSKKYQLTHPGLKWCVADATKLDEFTDQSFDVVIDKGACDTFDFRADKHSAALLLGQYFASIARVRL